MKKKLYTLDCEEYVVCFVATSIKEARKLVLDSDEMQGFEDYISMTKYLHLDKRKTDVSNLPIGEIKIENGLRMTCIQWTKYNSLNGYLLNSNTQILNK